MKIVFFGSNDFSLKFLCGLIDMGQEIVGVVMQPDKINARNNKIIISPLKKYCLDNNIKLFQFAKLNLEGEQPLKELNADLFITASYGQIIKQNILDIPKFATINVHTSLLPKYRGSAPVQYAILNGEKITGVTIMKTELGLDTGDIYLQKQIEILDDDTTTSMFEKLSTLGVECLKEFFDNFDYYINHHTKQDESKASYFPMIKKEDYQLNFNALDFELVNKVRALENCYFIYNDVRYKVLKMTTSNLKGKAGEILACNSKMGLVIGCKNGAVEVVTIQPEGKQPMPAKAYMNSNKFRLADIIY